MDLPAKTLKAQLDAAYLALDTLARDRMRWRLEAARLGSIVSALEQRFANPKKSAKADFAILRALTEQLAESEESAAAFQAAFELVAEVRRAEAEKSAAGPQPADNQIAERLITATARLPEADKSAAAFQVAYNLVSEQLTTVTLRLAEAAGQLTAAVAKSESLQAHLDALHELFSWRVTRPLRAAGRLARWVLGTARQGRDRLRRFGGQTKRAIARLSWPVN